MKIDYLVTSLENGGAEFAIPSIVQSLQRHGCEVRVIACEPRDMKAAPKLEEAGIPYEVMFYSRKNVFIYTRAYLKRVKSDPPDVIWTSLSGATMVGQLVGKLAHIPVVSWKHSAKVRIYTQFFRKLSQLWVADSAIVELFLHETMRISKKDILSWPLYYCDMQDNKTNFWDGKRVLRIGSMGRLREQKNYAVLVEAIDVLLKNRPDLKKRFTLSIAGRGPLMEMLNQKIIYYKLENSIYLLGYNERPEEFLETLDIYIQPSTFEGMCLAAHEAMAASLPVVATPVGELAYSVIDKETGFLVTGDLKYSIAHALEKFFDEPDTVTRYGKKARDFVSQKYSLKSFDEASGRIVQHIKNILVKRNKD
ncbi:hypothetical protein ACI01nite_00010 [Acetobacter cibinongensis]|uniref:Glycosyl transferase group 1 n=1 Tax=Acetobacter cibinongensis TaxID=146475 RepID=A0A0D6N655_9PROT|nr:glycosyltransferase family 4 protein [Acetobacter cibinongensis]GAN61507.1 glycosyl transferase group 1 [Acetobacter cibinongensis]GBQ15944.1 glycosyltransferase [Acetobacter cibinongensis NRIC 0482]GEL57399.1 hypothetical protein ACI01nite_00010 [Acetobacter cibinongensis]